jgi:hypothetical protein
MVSDVAHSPSQRVSIAVPYAMLDTIVLDDAELKGAESGNTMESKKRSYSQSALLRFDRSHDIRHASEIAIVDLRHVYEGISRGIELCYGRQSMRRF